MLPFNAIVDLLLPYFSTRAERQALIEGALFGCPVLDRIEWEGTPHAFTVHLVRTLVNYGTCDDETPALITVLEAVRAQVGLDKQKAFDAVIAEARTIKQKRGQLVVRTRRYFAVMGGGILLAVLIGIGSAFGAWRYTDYRYLPELDNGFNVVVAGFGERASADIDEAIMASADADNVSKQVVNEIEQLYDANSDATIDHLLVYPRVPRILGDTAQREAQVQRIAERTGADVVIYGYITDNTERNLTIVPEFYFSPATIEQEPELAASGTLRSRISYLKDFDDTSSELSERFSLMRHFIRGLGQYLVNNLDDARQAFEMAIDQIPDNADRDENYASLYILAANVAIRQDDYAQALTWYTAPLDMRPTYARALSGRGAVFYQMALDQHQGIALTDRPLASGVDCRAETPDSTYGLLQLAEICFQEAEATDDKPAGSDAYEKVLFNLGQLYAFMSQAGYADRWADAERYLAELTAIYEQEADEAPKKDRIRQIAAQAYALRGLHLLETDRSAAALDQAEAHYQRAIELLEADIQDNYNDDFIAEFESDLARIDRLRASDSSER
jgi:tetratricopeptide (TPR) repeat protein